MSKFLKQRKKQVQTVIQIEEGVAYLMEVIDVEETDFNLKVTWQSPLTDTTVKTNLKYADGPYASINKVINAINPDAESLEEFIGAKLVVVFSVKPYLNQVYYNVTEAFPLESALLNHFEELERNDEFLEETEFEETEFDEDEQYEAQEAGNTSTLLKSSGIKPPFRKLGGNKGDGKLKSKFKPLKSRNVAAEVEDMLQDDEVEE